MADIKNKIGNAALAAGFDAVGFAPTQLSDVTRARLQQFLAQGYHGSMDWMAARADERGNPQVLWPAARSVICLGMNYGPESDPRDILQHTNKGAISVYAQGDDYHDVLKKRQRALASWIATEFKCEVKIFVDTAPVMEKPLAQAAGLGWQGKHTNVVSRTHGSWLFLAEIFTTLELESDAPEPDHCGNCSACLTACPTQAFVAPYKLDARRCISYLTIEHKGVIDDVLKPLMGNRIYGCDDCLAACPWNKFAQVTDKAEFKPRAVNSAPELAELAQLDDAAFRARFSKSPIKRIGVKRFLRNVMVAIGNSGDASLRTFAARYTDDEDDGLRDAARWAAVRLVVV